MSRFQVVVGNVGTVYAGDDGAEANRLFDVYVDSSKSGVGRAGGEDVYLFADDEIAREHLGNLRTD